MEDIEMDELCNSCICKRNNCKNVEIKKQGTCLVYKCLNYKINTNEIHQYEKFKYFIRSNNDKIKNKKISWGR
jgi:hypothetical protein